jgi:UDP-2,3-diacylglucosamine hydrolase
MATLFFSDLHIEQSRPEVLRWLTGLLDGPARAADALYILGDLFEYWIGDDAPSPGAEELAQRLNALSTAGVPIYFIHGNRDFMLGADYAASAGLVLLPETRVVDMYGQPTLILHGDTLCTDDVEYQAFRRQSRDPGWQAAVLARSVRERLQLAREARDASMRHTGLTAPDIMDVNEEAVRRAFVDHDVTRMIHGHTHRPAVHHHDLGGGHSGERHVLADWYDRGSYLEVRPTGVRAVELQRS